MVKQIVFCAALAGLVWAVVNANPRWSDEADGIACGIGMYIGGFVSVGSPGTVGTTTRSLLRHEAGAL